MSAYPRYAIYFIPAADSALYRFGAGLLGYDVLGGETVAHPDDVLRTIPDWYDLTRDPRRYGFHATLKAPFALAEGTSEPDLLAAFDDFANTPRAIAAIAPAVRLVMGRFVAIVPDAAVPELQEFANQCVTAFEPFRAPLSDHDRARRLQSRLSEKQIGLLERWGYPYVFDEFFFHMSLTGKIERARAPDILQALEARFARLETTTIAVDRLALLRQDNPSASFVTLRHALLAESPRHADVVGCG